MGLLPAVLSASLAEDIHRGTRLYILVRVKPGLDRDGVAVVKIKLAARADIFHSNDSGSLLGAIPKTRSEIILGERLELLGAWACLAKPDLALHFAQIRPLIFKGPPCHRQKLFYLLMICRGRRRLRLWLGTHRH